MDTPMLANARSPWQSFECQGVFIANLVTDGSGY